MKCVIQEVLELAKKQPRKIQVIKRFLKMKYNIKMDKEVLRRRIEKTIAQGKAPVLAN